MEVLVRRAKNHNADAFCELMDLHMQSMYKVAKAYLKNDEDVADAIQETILLCYEKLGTLKKNKYFKTWMTRILINICKDILKEKNRMSVSDMIPEEQVIDVNFDNLEWNELLQSLEEKYRTIILLYYVEGFKVREIAEILDMNESTVKSRLQRGRSKVAEEYHLEKIELREERV